MLSTAQIVANAHQLGLAVPAFNVPHLPMIQPVVQAVIDQDAFTLVEVARIEWIKFDCIGPAEVLAEYQKWQNPAHVRLHLDHVPVIDEEGGPVDYLALIHQAVDLGYDSVMIDGSKLELEENIAATRQAVEIAHQAGIPCEAELGAVLRQGVSMPSYEELYRSGLGFTKVGEAQRFVQETSCDWLSVAVGSFHGAVSTALKDLKKAEAHLNLELLDELRQVTDIPLVLHGGSGVNPADVLAAVKRGITKINVGAEVRQAYDSALEQTGRVVAAQTAVYEKVSQLLRDTYHLTGTRKQVAP